MRFLTAAWHRGQLSDDEVDDVEARFASHRAAFAQSTTGALHDLAVGRSLHDALVEAVEVNRSMRSVSLHLLARDRLRGYVERTIVYRGVDLQHLDTAALASIVRDPASELLVDELHSLDAGVYAHGLLFWPHYREMSFRFAHVHMADDARTDRVRRPIADRPVESDSAAV
jgi:hypothetical protein